MNVSDAAALLGLSPAYLPVVARQTGILMGVEHGRLWFDLASVEAEAQRRAHEAERWVSYVEAARIAGCSAAMIGAAVQSGDLAHRSAGRGDRGGRASIDRDSAVAFGRRRAQELADMAAAKQSLKSSYNGPPDDGQVWLSSSVSGLILGISAGRVHQLAAADRLPHVRVGNRLWFRRRDIEQIAAARAFRLRQRHHSGGHNPSAGSTRT